MDWEKIDLSKNDIRINLAEFFWELLDQWKAMALTGLLFAVIITGCFSIVRKADSQPVSDEDGAETAMSEEDKRTYDEIVSGLPELDKVALDTAMEARSTLQDYLDYQEKSPLMNVDALNETKAVSVIDIKNMGGLLADNLTEINTKIPYFFAGDEFINSMKEALGWDYDTEFVRELMAASGGIVDFDSASTEPENGAERCTCTVIIPVDKDGQGLQDAFGKALEDYMNREFPEYASKCIVSPFSYYESTAADANTASLQAANTASIGTSRANSDSYKAALRVDALKAYGLYYNEDVSEALGLLTTSLAEEAKATFTPSLPMTFILGFLMGAAIYAVILFARVIIFPCAGRLMVMSSLMPGMYAGSIIDSDIGNRELFRSRPVEKHRYGNIEPLEDQGRSIRSVIDFNKRHSNAPTAAVSFVYWSDIKEAHLGLFNYIMTEDDMSNVIDVKNNESAYIAADEARSAVLVIEDGRTPLKRVRGFLRLLKAADCDLLGYLYLR